MICSRNRVKWSNIVRPIYRVYRTVSLESQIYIGKIPIPVTVTETLFRFAMSGVLIVEFNVWFEILQR